MKKRNSILILLLCILLAGALVINAAADAGNFSGSSDYGGGSDWGSSSDWSSDSDWSSSGGGSGSPVLIGVAALAFIIIFAVFSRGAKKNKRSVSGGATPTASLSPIGMLADRDRYFSEAAMKEKIANLYVRLQNQWTAGDLTPMRPYMSDALYSQFERQLNELNSRGQTNHVDRIAVLDVTLNGWYSDDVNDAVVAMVKTRIVDYTVEAATGKLVSGSNTKELFMTYEYTLVRSKGMMTPAPGEGEGTVVVNCPNCGAPLAINQSGKCPYCDSIITAKDYDWVISAIKGISQQSS